MDEVTSKAERDAVVAAAWATLNANRNLCEDFVDVVAVDEQPFVLCAEIEVAPDAELDRLQAAILFGAQEYLAPPVNQYTLAEMLARTRPDGTPNGAADLFDGPALEHGFIDDAELDAAELRTEIRLSDLIRLVMELPGVLAVRDMVIDPGGGALADRWRVPVAAGRKATLDRERCRLVFYKRNMPFVVTPEQYLPEWNRLVEEARARVETAVEYDFPIPLGRYRQPAEYYSFQNHFPAIYGLGEAGLPGGADERRARLADQLRGYLLFFDQLMADSLAQLAHLRDLFSTDPTVERTYFHQTVDSFTDFARIYRSEDPQAALDSALDDAEGMVERRNRFLDHLIARHAERFHDFVAVMRSVFGASAASMIPFKCDFLKDYPALGAERSLAYDYTLQGDADLWNSDNVSGLERRLGRLLGIPNVRRRNLGEISYDIYAEVDSTPGDEFRFRVRRRDTGKILLSSSRHYTTEAQAREEMRRAIRFASLPSGYQRKALADGRHYFNVVDETGAVAARRIEYFASEAAMNAAIDDSLQYLREQYNEEGMYLIENILLRPGPADDPFLPICPDPGCAECADEDPYSYRIHVILPAYGGRFDDMRFRRWAESVIREETPAHIQPRICWISKDDMAALEKLYRDWIYLRSGRDTAGRTETLTAFYDRLFRVKNVYPVQSLRECDAGTDKFILGQTALGTLK
jgi:hypothetical protein